MLAKRIMMLRKIHGMSQLQLAQKLCVSASTIGMYEQGRRVPSIEVFVMMSQVFRVSLDYLITGSEFKKTDNALIQNDIYDMQWCCCCCLRRKAEKQDG